MKILMPVLDDPVRGRDVRSRHHHVGARPKEPGARPTGEGCSDPTCAGARLELSAGHVRGDRPALRTGAAARRGGGLSGRHYITGEFRGRNFCCFEYTTGTIGVNDGPGRDKPTFWTVLAVAAPGPGPELVVRRPQALDGMTQRGRLVPLGVPEFDGVFRVITDDEVFARNALIDEVVPFLVTEPRAGKDTPIRLHNDELLTWYRGRLSPLGIDARLNYQCDVLDRIPPRVWSRV